MHFRLSIIVVLILVITAGGLVYWQTRSTDTTSKVNTVNSNVVDQDRQEIATLDSYGQEIDDFTVAQEMVAQTDISFEDLASDAAAQNVTSDTLDSDVRELDALGQNTAAQQTDQAEIETTFSEIINFAN